MKKNKEVFQFYVRGEPQVPQNLPAPVTSAPQFGQYLTLVEEGVAEGVGVG